MFSMKNKELRIIEKICKADSKLESFELFLGAKDILEDWYIIFSSEHEKTEIPELLLSKNITQDSYLCNILEGNTIFVLSKAMVESMIRQDNKPFNIDYSIAFDTQFTSYLKRTVFNNASLVPDSFIETLDYVIKNELNFDPFEYLYENIPAVFNKDELIFDTLLAYDILKTIDMDIYRKNKEIISYLPDNLLKEIVDSELDETIITLMNVAKSIYDIYQLSYALLLKMVEIQFKHQNKSKVKKLEMLLNLMQEKLGKVCIRELIIADTYFDKGQKLKFFRKIQKGSKKNIKDLKNMAWDLFHIHQMERNFCIMSYQTEDFSIPLFLTFDKGLSEIIQLCSINTIAYNKKDMTILPFYKAISKLEEMMNVEILKTYFLEETKEKRIITSNLKNIIIELENEILKF